MSKFITDAVLLSAWGAPTLQGRSGKPKQVGRPGCHQLIPQHAGPFPISHQSARHFVTDRWPGRKHQHLLPDGCRCVLGEEAGHWGGFVCSLIISSLVCVCVDVFVFSVCISKSCVWVKDMKCLQSFIIPVRFWCAKWWVYDPITACGFSWPAWWAWQWPWTTMASKESQTMSHNKEK